MASKDVVEYQSPVRRVVNVAVVAFLAIYLLWTILPIFVMFVSSLKDLLQAFRIPAVGDWSGLSLFFDFEPTFKHYTNLFVNLNFGVYFFNSVLFFWIISTRMAPVVAVMVPLYAIFRSLELVGSLWGLILAYTTFNLPFAIWILKGFFDNVPYAIEEAQMVDGATRMQAFRSILPLVAPGIGAFLVLCVLFAWNDFLFASIIGSGGAKTLPVATKELVQPQNIQWGSIMAAGVVTTLPMMFLGLLIRRYLVTGLTMGAVRE
jgi:multiple sugar transport system permease protein